jgi:trk system potassium uptake protein TrkH
VKKQLTPFQSLTLGFVILIFVGTILLTLPIATASHKPNSFINALFTATSAVSTTGLVVVDTGSFYSLFGQIIILILFQIGGLGYMILIVLIAYLVGKKLSIRDKMTFRESIAGISYSDIKQFTKVILLFTIFFELIGAILLSIIWAQEFSLPYAIYAGVFHSISAFCTAGFSIFANSFVPYYHNLAINIIISVISVAGGLGFFVLNDIRNLVHRKLSEPRLSVHSKLALTMTVILIVVGFLVIFFTDKRFSLFPLKDRILTACFQIVSAASTTGFNSIDIALMSLPSLFTIIILMFIGSSPGGTGGGIKTTTFGLIICFVSGLLKGKTDVNLYEHTIPLENIKRALAIFVIALLWIMVAVLILTITEHSSLLNILFEVTSGFGTVGLSTGLTPYLSLIGKIVISVTMLFGRIGPLAIGYALVGKIKPARYKSVEGSVFIG